MVDPLPLADSMQYTSEHVIAATLTARAGLYLRKLALKALRDSIGLTLGDPT